MFYITPFHKANDLFVNPFHELDALEHRFFDTDDFSFRTDIEDKGECFELTADLPGFSKDDIKIDLDDDHLTIQAERHSNCEKKESKYLCQERTYGSYSRSFSLEGIDASGITASYDNGILTLDLPKEAPAKPETRRLEIR